MRIRVGVAIILTGLLTWGALVWVRVTERDEHLAGIAHSTSSGAPAAPDGGGAARLPWPRTGQAAMEVEGRGSLGSSGGDASVPIASLAKVMTAYLVLQQDPLRGGDRGFTVTIGRDDVADYGQRRDTDQSVVRVQAGEVIDERDLLEALMLPSGNNIAIVLAEHEAGSVAAFVSRMNSAADRLGLHHTHYTDPSGWDEGTVSSAEDQLVLARTALRDPVFARIVAMRSSSLPVAGRVPNLNPLLDYPGFAGVKTGSEDASGGCLAFAAVRRVDGHDVRVVGVVLGQRGGELIHAAAEAARPLLDAVYSALAESGGS